MFKKYGKKMLIALGAILLLLQFVRPAKNLSNDQSQHLNTKYPVPEDVQAILTRSCDDCHSNKTVYPWYAEIQPVGIWLANHVNEGKRHLNFSTFTSRKIAIQNHKLEEIIEMVKEGEMPLGSYTLIHRDAILSEAQKERLTSWAAAMMDTLKTHYPADSLVLRRPPAAPSK